ncbi:sugar ABC transporter substrate-binding protein [Arthrobacter alpinus]|uniref:extracellular solute-binding protein n=1 Tax=Arthrobacter alpinus TaxID=656366 RepID=UPI0005C92B8A|nr:extracellular solute-binding protein [Arthrobacter alpinus]ALV46942.1 sugar ABC transporter substrate-binding protein [Arthrobacter alpinus]
MKIRNTLATGIAVATVLALSACTGGTAAPAGDAAGDGKIGGEITFQTWSLKNDKFTPYFEGVVDAFEKANPGTTVKWIDQPADGYEDKILQQAGSGELPDVLNLPPEYGYSLASAGQLLDLSKSSKVLGDYVEGGVDAYTYDGVEGSFGFPWYLGTELNYWNKALLTKGGVDKTPTNVDEMLDAAEKLAGAGIQSISDVPSPKSLQSLVSDSGDTQDVYADGKFVFNTPAAVAVIERYAELYKLGAVSPEALQGAGTLNSNITNFNKGTVAWATAGPNYIDKDIAVNAPKLLPDVDVTNGFGNPPLFVQGISVSGKSKNEATALAFAEFLTNTGNQIDFVKLAVGFFPGTIEANKDVSVFAESAKNDMQKTANELAASQMSDARMLGAPQFTEAMNNYAQQQIALAVKGEISAEEALTKSVTYAEQNVVD